MKKIISLLVSAQTLILLTAAALIFSSCVIVNPDDEFDVVVEKKDKTPVTTTTSNEPAPSPRGRYSITCRNETEDVVTDWFVKKDNTVNYSNSDFNNSIGPGRFDMITNLPEGYYVVFYTFRNTYQLNPRDYQSVSSIYLNSNVTYCILERDHDYYAECYARSADAVPHYYLAGSDGSEIDLISE